MLLPDHVQFGKNELKSLFVNFFKLCKPRVLLLLELFAHFEAFLL